MTPKEQGLQTIIELCKRFKEQFVAYKKAEYNETQTRRDFIDPFFKALGWDIDNTQGFAESYREVIHEDRVKVGKATKAPDYSFRLGGGKRLFFVEAKKPSVDIKDDIQPAYQVRRYGWSAKLKVSIITDFEEFAVYDCSKKPNPNDKAAVARVKYFTYIDFEKEWDFLWETFSKEAVLKGSFDKFLLGNENKKGTTTVDKDFLNSLDNWRTVLAETISKENKKLDEDELNFVVQQTLDRIIFLRIAEDRSIENYGNLQQCVNQGGYFENILKLFKQADDKYNSGLFDFKKDTLSAQLKLNNKTLKSIINQLYYPECPYEFSVLSVEILGSAYEQFLGKTITINSRGKAIIELKPEVRKAGGVYYTPQYIVDYIVESTIGKLVIGKKPLQVADLKIVDPACGSGSFLIGAYQYLLNWHKDYYIQNPQKENPLTPEGNLNTAEKKKILLNNIYGVDIDTNAVEVTKLSLLLKCLEGETQASIAHQMSMFNQRVLPTLDHNIQSGNSLIDTDYYENQMDFGEERKIKPFNWKKAFPEVFNREIKVDFQLNLNNQYNKVKNFYDDSEAIVSNFMVSEPPFEYGNNDYGGFDVVIGNPPWVSLNGKFGSEIVFPMAQKYLIDKYNGNTYMPNLYEYFVHKGLELINENGLFSFIVPDRLGFNNQFISLRKKILQKYRIQELIYKAPFPDIVTDTLIFRFSNIQSGFYDGIKVSEFGKEVQIKKVSDYLNNEEFQFLFEVDNHVTTVLKSIFENKHSIPLGGIASTTSGFGGKSSEISDLRINKKQIEIIRGRSIHKFATSKTYFFEFKKENITGRTTDKTKLGIKEKVLIRKTGFPLIATYDESGFYPEQSLYFVYNCKSNISLKYISALINSKLFQFIYINKLVTNKDSTPQLKNIDLNKFPIRQIDFSNESDCKAHNDIVKNVEQLLQINKDYQTVTLESKKNQMKTKIDYCEEKINDLIYQLYNLTATEIEIIEKNINK